MKSLLLFMQPPNSALARVRCIGRRFFGTLVLSSVAAFLASPCLAQQSSPESTPPQEQSLDDSVVIEVNDNQRAKFKLAYPAPKRPVGAPPGISGAIAEADATLRNDLRLTSVFSLQGPRDFSELRLTGERVNDFDQYRSLGNRMVLLVETKLDGTRLVLEGSLYDLASRQLILGKRYVATADLARQIAHTLSDEIVFYLTGVPGIARTSLAFTSDRDGDGIKELYLMDYDGYNQRKMTGHRSLSFSPSWAENGSGLAYISYYSGVGPSLYWVDRTTGNKSVLLEEDSMALSPTISPDGNRIAFGRSFNGNLEIYTIRRDGSQLTRLTKSGGIDTNPAWSPKGNRIAFTSSRIGSPQIYTMDPDGKNIRRMSFQGKYNEGAAWDPDGRFLVYASRSRNGSRFDIVKLDVETGEQTTLTAAPGRHEAPSFSPDGRFIAYESDRSGRKQIYIMTSSGVPVAQLTNGSNNYGPSWSGYLN